MCGVVWTPVDLRGAGAGTDERAERERRDTQTRDCTILSIIMQNSMKTCGLRCGVRDSREAWMCACLASPLTRLLPPNSRVLPETGVGVPNVY